MDDKLKMSNHCTLAVMEANFILGTLKKCSSRLNEVIIPLCLAYGKPYIVKLECVQWRSLR